jgi:large conductance mechanosensitive channel
MSLLTEFKEFAVKGNVVDMAVGILVGAAFGKIATSLVKDVITPPIGLLVGGIDFTGLSVNLRDAADGHAPITLNYGVFLQTVFDFLIVAFCVFMAVKAINRLKLNAPAAAPGPSNQEVLLTEIRDLLKDRK